MTGFVNYTKLPLRLAVFSGLVIGGISFVIAMAYLLLKLAAAVIAEWYRRLFISIEWESK